MASDQIGRLAELERTALGNEIHDSLMPLLFAASAGIGRLAEDAEVGVAGGKMLSPADRTERLRQVSKWLGDAMTAGRSILRHAYLPGDVRSSWHQALKTVVSDLLADVVICWNIDPHADQVNGDVATAAYRVAFEAIRNASRHATGPITVAARVCPDSGDLKISVEDHGRGFDVDEVAEGHYGLRSMKSRAASVGGSLQIQSQPGSGTRVELTIPLGNVAQHGQ